MTWRPDWASVAWDQEQMEAHAKQLIGDEERAARYVNQIKELHEVIGPKDAP